MSAGLQGIAGRISVDGDAVNRSNVLHVAVPGVQTLGIGDIIFGKRSPGGRTTQTMYPVSYQDEISIFDM